MTMDDNLWRALKFSKSKGKQTYEDVARRFFWKGSKLTARKVRYELRLGLPSKRHRKVDPKKAAARETRAKWVEHFAVKKKKEVTKIEKKVCTELVPRYRSCSALAAVVSKKISLQQKLSPETVRLDLLKMGFTAYTQLKTALLTDEAKERRLAFARKYKGYFETENKKIAKKKKIFFSDESQFDRNPKAKLFQWAKSRKDVSAVLTRTSNGPRVMVWGMIGPNYKSELIILRKTGRGIKNAPTVTAAVYIKKCLKKTILDATKGGFFQQDNAKIHTAKVVKDHLAKSKVDVLPDWPAYSPDMNPIEKVWGLMKRKLHRNDNLDTHAGLIAAVQREWNAIPIKTINKLCDNFVTTLGAVFAAKGGRV